MTKGFWDSVFEQINNLNAHCENGTIILNSSAFVKKNTVQRFVLPADWTKKKNLEVFLRRFKGQGYMG